MKIISVTFLFTGLLTIALASPLQRYRESDEKEALLQMLLRNAEVQQILPEHEVWCYDSAGCQGDPISPYMDIYQCCHGHPFRSYKQKLLGSSCLPCAIFVK